MDVAEDASVISPSKGEAGSESLLQRYVPLAAWAIAILALVFLVLKIVSYGLLPAGDARRHIGKAFTDKSYSQILVMRPEFSAEPDPGWEGLLRVLYRGGGWDADGLAAFSVAFTMLCLLLAPLPWLRRPEAWLAALLAQVVAVPSLAGRLILARPALFTEAVLIAVLISWGRDGEKPPSRLKLALTTAGIALSVWMGGAWYLWAIPLTAFVLAGWWKPGLRLAGCIAAGVLGGALLTGRPIAFLSQPLMAALAAAGETVPEQFLTADLRPTDGNITTLLLVGLVLFWRSRQSIPGAASFTGPLFWQLVICWILGLHTARFWWDWGIPAVLVWLALRGEEMLSLAWAPASPRRLLLCGFLGFALYLNLTADQDGRYTYSRNERFLDARTPDLAGWFPAAGGIFYTAQPDFFPNTFYQNPRGDWRYILGTEPAFMPEEDLRIYRHIQLSGYNVRAFEPWIGKMGPADRLVLASNGTPSLSQLEWKHALGNLWIGRVPGNTPQ